MKILYKIEKLLKFDKSEKKAMLLVISLVLAVTVTVKVIYQTSIDRDIDITDTRINKELSSDTTHIEDDNLIIIDTMNIDDIFDYSDNSSEVTTEKD